MVCQIRPIRSSGRLRECASLQQKVWGFAQRDIVTPGMLASCAKFGGIVLGAYAESCMVGFVFSLPALLGQTLIQHSHMLAVLPPFRDQGIGTRLKWAQFRAAQEQGVSLITWTFDPLESKNAFLNLRKLGTRSQRYYVDLYGTSTSSDLHAGLGTDRLLAEWQVRGIARSPRTGRLTAKEITDLPQTIRTDRNSAGLIVPKTTELSYREQFLAVEIPTDIQQLKVRDPELARRWRNSTRLVFRHYLDQGYRVVGFAASSGKEASAAQGFYCLEKAEGDC